MSDFWKLEKDAAVVEGVRFGLALPVSEREVNEAGEDFRAGAEAWATLQKAIISFEAGAAIYRDCLRNVLDLRSEMRQARRMLAQIYAGLYTFFNQEDIASKSPFSLLSDELKMQFAADLLGHLARLAAKPEAAPPAEAVGK